MKPSSAVLWTLAVVITLGSAVWQRTTGPTYPARGRVTLGGQPLKLKLLRTHPGAGDLPVRVEAARPDLTGVVAWRRYPTQEAWQALPMQRTGDALEAAIPHQPAAGKVEYQVKLRAGGEEAVFPPRPAVARYRGEVSPFVLVPHVLAMFLGMLGSNKSGLDALFAEPSRRVVWLTCVLIGLGGFLLGPAVQKMAFDAWWTGIPFGYDLTDNKTLIAGAAWAFALWRVLAGRPARVAVAVAAVVTLAVFAIPHSVWGSEIHWEQVKTS